VPRLLGVADHLFHSGDERVWCKILRGGGREGACPRLANYMHGSGLGGPTTPSANHPFGGADQLFNE
jgi:hypothetical protein